MMEATLDRPAIEVEQDELYTREFETRPPAACQLGELACDTCVNVGCPLLALREPESPTFSGEDELSPDSEGPSVREQLFDDRVDFVVAEPPRTENSLDHTRPAPATEREMPRKADKVTVKPTPKTDSNPPRPEPQPETPREPEPFIAPKTTPPQPVESRIVEEPAKSTPKPELRTPPQAPASTTAVVEIPKTTVSAKQPPKTPAEVAPEKPLSQGSAPEPLSKEPIEKPVQPDPVSPTPTYNEAAEPRKTPNLEPPQSTSPSIDEGNTEHRTKPQVERAPVIKPVVTEITTMPIALPNSEPNTPEPARATATKPTVAIDKPIVAETISNDAASDDTETPAIVPAETAIATPPVESITPIPLAPETIDHADFQNDGKTPHANIDNEQAFAPRGVIDVPVLAVTVEPKDAFAEILDTTEPDEHAQPVQISPVEIPAADTTDAEAPADTGADDTQPLTDRFATLQEVYAAGPETEIKTPYQTDEAHETGAETTDEIGAVKEDEEDAVEEAAPFEESGERAIDEIIAYERAEDEITEEAEDEITAGVDAAEAIEVDARQPDGEPWLSEYTVELLTDPEQPIPPTSTQSVYELLQQLIGKRACALV